MAVNFGSAIACKLVGAVRDLLWISVPQLDSSCYLKLKPGYQTSAISQQGKMLKQVFCLKGI